MNIKKIIRETLEDFEWTNLGGDFIQVDSNNVYEGMEVMLNPKSSYHNQAPYVWGKVTCEPNWSSGDLWVNVYFDNGRGNSYRVGPNDFDLLTIKNINESEDDITGLDWIMDVNPYNITDKDWIIHFDVDCDLDEVRRLQEWIYSQGFIWNTDATIEEMSTDCDSKYYFRVYTNGIEFDAYLKWNEPLEEMIDMGFVMYKWSDIKSTLQINESEDDITNLEWIIKSQPIDLDETVKKYVDQGYVVAIWFGDMDDDLRTYVNNFIIKEKFYWSSPRQDTAWIYGNTFKGITFYPSRAMGGFHGVNAREKWDNYRESVINREYEDVDPDEFISIEL